MERHDVIVLGAGLAGLSAARDLDLAGTDVLVLEARARAGGRVEQTTAPDGRLVQLGGEIVGTFHTAYRQLVQELGLTLGSTFTSTTGETLWSLGEGAFVGDAPGWMTDADRAAYDRIEREFAKLSATVDPDDPWAHPDAEKLDRLSAADWVRAQGGTPAVLRALNLANRALATEPIERLSLLADLRKESAAGAGGFYDFEVWENERVLEGSATVALRMAEALGSRIRYSSPAAAVHVSDSGCHVQLATGEIIGASAIVSAIPVGPLRDIRITGVSDARLASLHWQRHARAAKIAVVYEESFWEADGCNGTTLQEETIIGGLWAQNTGILSGLIPPVSLGEYFATPAHLVQRELTAELVGLFGAQAGDYSCFYMRNWATDPWTRGYVTGWRPGDVTAVGPLHGTHEPPFYVCGSDQWVCGYMEGAVRTGRAAAAAVLGSA
ncbi:flavin monoamine oxidase family protein [Leucobacter soli]|uniref:Putrescine oxidase n=1 Tax=Leucobacter soli TaxID=2812850 RepID=A0A916K3T5_9MICO|nr:NAD(P)/FAD-dependent oxidoreductase [Leucobacter soli]CAG7621264.1 Putrescine oxidase [Leucobacter soli]